MAFSLGSIFKQGRVSPPRAAKPFFNGMNPSSDFTITGGACSTVDKDGILRPSYIDQPAIKGGRWATTVAEGAKLGEELLSVAQQNLDGEWDVIGEATVADGVGRILSTSGDLSQIGCSPGITPNKRYFVQYTINSASGTGLANSTGSMIWPIGLGSNSVEYIADGTGLVFKRTGITDVIIDNISIREVIPQWLSTDIYGNDLQPSKVIRTAKGLLKEHVLYDTRDHESDSDYSIGDKVLIQTTEGPMWMECIGVSEAGDLEEEGSEYFTAFNGFEDTDYTYSGGPVVTEDNTGALVTSPADVLPITGMRLATTVEEGAALGDELIVNGDFSAWTGDDPTNWIVEENGTTTNITEVSGGARIISVDGTNVYMYANSTTNFLTIGKKYLYEVVIDVASGGLKTDVQYPTLIYDSGSGTYTGTFTATTEKFNICRHSGVTDVTVSSVSIREVIPTWLPTDLSGDPIHTSTPLRTRKGTVSKYAETYKGPLIEPARTNKCTCRKANPVDTTNVVAGSVTIIDDAANLSTAYDENGNLVDLTELCQGSVYKISSGSYAVITGNVANGNTHSSSAYVRGGSGSIGWQVDAKTAFSAKSAYTRVSHVAVPGSTAYQFVITADGGDVYFILPQLEEGAFCTSPICKASDGSDPLTSLTRPAANLTRPTAGTALESGNNFAIYGRVIPKAGGQGITRVFSSGDNTSNITINALDMGIYKTINAVVAGSAPASYTYSAGTPFEYLVYQHSVHGMGIAVRSWNGSVWSAWSAWGTNADTQNAPIASTYQIGARNNANHFAANYPFTTVIAIPPNANPQTWLMDALSAMGI
jgi:hypothetical protein